jgi:hypothetical protein
VIIRKRDSVSFARENYRLRPIKWWEQDWQQKELELQLYASVMDTDWYHAPDDGETAFEYFMAKAEEWEKERKEIWASELQQQI